MKHLTSLAAIVITIAAPAFADEAKFKTGPLIDAYGPVAEISDPRLTSETQLKVAFDIAKAAEAGKINRHLASAARFLNMHVAAGVPVENLEVAIVVHGAAAKDLVNDAAYGGQNANAGLIAALVDQGVTIELCGQTAAFRDISKDDLLPGIEISLSAMTSHALLQQNGYTLNPF